MIYLSKNQQYAIVKYVESILNDGYKVEFAVEICKSMTLLHKEGMDTRLSKDIGKCDEKNIAVFDKKYIRMRKEANEKLKEIMEKYDNSYKAIKTYIKDHHLNSWNDKAFAIKFASWTFHSPISF